VQYIAASLIVKLGFARISAATLKSGGSGMVSVERNAKKRREATAQLWTEACVFIDHGKTRGHGELDRAVAVLQELLPGYVFSELRPVDLLHESVLGLELWTAGPLA
jgi:hypothetical protein